MSRKKSLTARYGSRKEAPSESYEASTDEERVGLKKGDGAKMSYVFGAIALCMILIAVAWNMGKKHIALDDYITLVYTGADGYASAECVVDVDSIVKKLMGNDTDDAKERLYTQFANNIKASVLETDGGISNGDRLTVNVSYDSDLARTAGVSVGNEQFNVKAKGISAGVQIDLFENIEVIFAGISPDAYVVIKNEWEERFLSQLSFTADKQKNISANDEITIHCNADETELGQNGYVAASYDKTYRADRLSTYVDSVGQVDDSVVAEQIVKCTDAIEEATADTSFRMLYKATGDRQYLYMANDETAENVTLIDVKFMSRSSTASSELAKNKIALVFSADVTCSGASETVYFGYAFSNAYIATDGTFNIITGDSDSDSYVCSTSYDDVMKQILDGSETNYTIWGMDVR